MATGYVGPGNQWVTATDTPNPAAAAGAGLGILWADRPSAAAVGAGALQWFSDVGGGSLWRSDGTYWAPAAPVVLFRGAGTVAAPLATLTGVTSGVFVSPGNVPAGMFIRPGMRLQAQANFSRSTATATASLQINVGSQVVGFGVGAAVGQQVRLDTNVWCASASTQLNENWLQPQNSAASVFQSASVNFTTAQAFSVLLGAANVADSFTLLSYGLTIYP